MCTIVGGRGVGFVFHGGGGGWGWGLFTSEFVGGEGSIVPLGHRTLDPGHQAELLVRWNHKVMAKAGILDWRQNLKRALETTLGGMEC